MKSWFMIIIIVVIATVSLTSCGKKGRLNEREGFNYPRTYPVN